MISESFSFCFLEDSDFGATASLFSEVFLKSAKASDFEWKYRKDLFGRLYGVQVKDIDERVVAHVAAVPLEGMYSGERMLFFQFVDAMVHPLWRGRNTLTVMIHTLLDFIRSHHSVFFPYVFPGPVSSKIGQKNGWLRLIKPIEDVIITWSRKYGFFGRLGFISFERFDPESSPDIIDSIWEKNSRFFPVLIARDSAFLKWRYLSHPWFSYDFFLVKRLWKPVGWIVLERQTSNPPRIVDYFVPPYLMGKVFRCFLAEIESDRAILWVSDFLRKVMFIPAEFCRTPIDLALIFGDFISYLPPAEILSHCFFYTMGDIDIY